jgi:D-alanyl-D-alanine carboxypeptidase (penicillin-binding protein 5/6)
MFSLPLVAEYRLPPAPSIKANSYILIDYDTGKVMLEKDVTLPQDPASITKVMTAYVVFKEIMDNPELLDSEVRISEKAYKVEGSRTFLEINSSVPLKEVLLGLIVQSGNDAAIALAEHIDGSEEAFADKMNFYAHRLGMNTTQFINSTGLPNPEHYSSAEDVAKLAIALIREFPEKYKWFAQKKMTYNDIKQFNRNRLLWRDPTVDGIKTGYTSKAGYTLLASAKRENMRLISVVFGTKSDKSRLIQSQLLLNYGFRYFRNATIQKAGDTVLSKRIWFGENEQLNMGFQKDWVVAVPKRIVDKLTFDYQMDAERLEAPIKKHQKIGLAKVVYEGEILDSRPIYALEDVPKSGIFSQILDYIEYFTDKFLLSLFGS